MDIETLAQIAIRTLEQNKNCFVAQWVLQNPNVPLSQCKLAYQMTERGIMQFYIDGGDNEC